VETPVWLAIRSAFAVGINAPVAFSVLLARGFPLAPRGGAILGRRTAHAGAAADCLPARFSDGGLIDQQAALHRTLSWAAIPCLRESGPPGRRDRPVSPGLAMRRSP